MNSTDVNALLAKLAERRPRIIDLGLERIIKALERLGNPQDNLPPTIHVAGTNGKGSTIAYMRSILSAAGLKVHVYTSPHLVRFNERIVLAGTEIEDQYLLSVLGRCDITTGDEPLTYFEAVTCAAFLAFKETPADVLLLEVGLGGRLDATNVITAPRATVITPVALDHQSFLGDTLAEISGEKAGIIKPGIPVIIGKQNHEALTVIENRALALGAPSHINGQEWSVQVEHGRLVYQDDTSLSDLSVPRLFGSHQIENAGLAVAALKATGLAPDDDIISQGIEQTFWPARLQRLTQGPFIEQANTQFSDTVEIWLDGGHNPHAGQALARSLADLEERHPKPLILIAGMQSNKDAVGFFTPFEDLAAAIITVQADTDAAATAEMVANAAAEAGLSASPASSMTTAFTEALRLAKNAGTEAPRILICGSLHLAGEILQTHG